MAIFGKNKKKIKELETANDEIVERYNAVKYESTERLAQLNEAKLKLTEIQKIVEGVSPKCNLNAIKQIKDILSR